MENVDPGSAHVITSSNEVPVASAERAHRGATEDALSLRWRGLEDRRNPLMRHLPWWLVGVAALAVLAIAFTAYYASLAGIADPLHAQLAKVGLEEFSAPAQAVPVRGPTLKQLLRHWFLPTCVASIATVWQDSPVM